MRTLVRIIQDYGGALPVDSLGYIDFYILKEGQPYALVISNQRVDMVPINVLSVEGMTLEPNAKV
jgi:hypothetical protein